MNAKQAIVRLKQHNGHKAEGNKAEPYMPSWKAYQYPLPQAAINWS